MCYTFNLMYLATQDQCKLGYRLESASTFHFLILLSYMLYITEMFDKLQAPESICSDPVLTVLPLMLCMMIDAERLFNKILI